MGFGAKTAPDRAKTWRRQTLSSVFTLCTFLMISIAPQVNAADPDDISKARDLMNTCQDHFGDRHSAAKAFRSMGTRTIHHNANYRTATANDERVFVSSGTMRNWIGCIVVVADMSRQEATQLATQWVKKINGTSDKPRKGSSVWTGAYDGMLARVEIGSISNPIITGTGIAFEVNKHIQANTQTSQ